MSIGAALLFTGALLSAALSAYFALKNRRLDKRHGSSRAARAWVTRAQEEGEGRKSGGDEDEDVLDGELLKGLSAGVASKDFRYVT